MVENSEYPYEKKVHLVDKISKIKSKKVLVKIFEIINEDNKDISINSNGIFMYFNKLNNDTYYEIEHFLRQINKKNKLNSTSSDDNILKKEYKPYVVDDFPSQKGMCPKLKYSNREKNLIKRKRYDNNINSENKVDESIVYCYYDSETISDQEKKDDDGSKN